MIRRVMVVDDDLPFLQNLQQYDWSSLGCVCVCSAWVYRTGIENFNISLSSAVGLFKSVISFVLVVTVNTISRRWGESMW